MLASILSAYDGLKSALSIVQGLNAATTQVQINDVKIMLQQHILDAQNALTEANGAQSTARQRIRDQEQEIMNLKDWSAEKERYQLKALGRRAFGYTVKPGMERSEDPHWLCQNCFDTGHKSALQFSGISNPGGGTGLMASWGCGHCKTTVWVSRNHSPSFREDD